MSNTKEKDIGEVVLDDVVLSFPHLFDPQEGRVDPATGIKGAPKFNAAFLIPKSRKDLLAKVAAARNAVVLKKYGTAENAPKYKPEKLCYRDGDLESYDGYAGTIYVSAASPANRPPKVLDRDKTELTKTNGGLSKIYGGARVDAVVRLWVQDNEHGKRVNASVEAVRFRSKGEAFGARPVDVDEAFADLADDDDMEPMTGSGGGSDADDDLLG